MTPADWALYDAEGEADFGYEVPGVLRVRCNVFRQRKGIAGAFRILPTRILTAEQLGLPDAVIKFANLTKGLVVMTGPPGSGKSTTQAALLDHVNRTKRRHIITIEDPIEYVHENKLSLINQREIRRHTRSFDSALRSALREVRIPTSSWWGKCAISRQSPWRSPLPRPGNSCSGPSIPRRPRRQSTG